MAELPNTTNFDTSYAYRQLMQQQGQQVGSGNAPIFMGANLNTNVGSPFSLQSAALIPFDKMIKPAKQAANGPVAGLLKQLGLVGPEILEGLKKCNAPAQQCSITDITGQSHGLGGGMTIMATNAGAPDDLSRG